jgi:hypothetical protein
MPLDHEFDNSTHKEPSEQGNHLDHGQVSSDLFLILLLYIIDLLCQDL